MAVPQNVGAARGMVGPVRDKLQRGENATHGPAALTERQQKLTHLWAYFRAQNYDKYKRAWDGSNMPEGTTERELIVTQGYTPPGFYDAGGATLPLQFRRPSAPYYLGRLIVLRFSSLLFGRDKHPKVIVEGDKDTENWLNAAIEAGQLWHKMYRARNFGGGQGSACVAFKFVDGSPLFEVFDPRWCTPEFTDPASNDVERLEIKFQYKGKLRSSTGTTEEWCWYRRVIDEESDTVWPKVPVGDGDEPAWDAWRHSSVEHGMGVCPVAWCQNVPNDDELDGDTDCHGAYDKIETVDRLVSQALRSINDNCDPKLKMSTDAEVEDVDVSAQRALIMTKGDDAGWMESSGVGAKLALEAADREEMRVCRMARVVLDEARSATAKTATEVDRDYSTMFEQLDVLREQYSEGIIKPILRKLVSAAARLSRSHAFSLPPRFERDEDGTFVRVEQKLGRGGRLVLKWPPHVKPTVTDTATAVRAAADATSASLIDGETGTQYVAAYFDIEDVVEVRARIDAEEAEAAEQEQAGFMDAIGTEVPQDGGGAGGAFPNDAQSAQQPPPDAWDASIPVEYDEEPVGNEMEWDEASLQDVFDSLNNPAPLDGAQQAVEMPTAHDGTLLKDTKIFSYEIEDGIFTINEVRASKGLGPLLLEDGKTKDPDGNMTLPKYRAKHAELFASLPSRDGGDRRTPDERKQEAKYSGQSDHEGE